MSVRSHAALGLAAGAMVLSGCAPREPLTLQLPPPARQIAETAAERGTETRALAEPDGDRTVFRAIGSRPAARLAGSGDPLDGRRVEFAFHEAPAEEALDAVIVGQLDMAFTAAPGLGLRITARTPGAVPASRAIAILERAITEQGGALIREDGLFVLRASHEGGMDASARRSGPGDLETIELDHVSAGRMLAALEPFADSSVRITADEAGRRLMVSGPRERVDAIRQAAAALDTDWMRALSFSMIRLRHVQPDTLAEELASVAAVQGEEAGVELIPLGRLQALLIVARSQSQLTRIEDWAARLDQPPLRQRGFHTIPVRNADAAAMAEDIAAALDDRGEEAPPVRIRANEASNTLIVWGDEEDRAAISDLVARLDILPEQVMIEVTIVEVVLNDELRFGVQWFFDTRGGGSFTFSELETGEVSGRFPGFAYRLDSNYVQAAVNALDSVSSVVVLSSPQLVTLNNRPATLQVGDQVPVITQSAVSVTNPDAPIVNSVQFRDTGVVLQVTPRINGDTIVLEIDQEVSDVAETRSSGIDSPTIQQRRFQTVVAARAGETVALGGLIRENRSDTRTGVPGARRVPVLGRLFETSADISRRTELIAFLTPRLVTDARDAREEAARMTSRLRELNARGVLVTAE